MKTLKLILYISAIITGISLIIFIIASLPYFINFKSGLLSTNSEDWGSFGSYIAGLTSIFNLAVFIILTVYLAKLENKNSDMQILTQKKIIISQFRQNEVNMLNDELDKTFVLDGVRKKDEIINIFTSATVYLTNFINQKQYLFPILREKLLQDKINLLLDKYDEFSQLIVKTQKVPKNEFELHRMETKAQLIITVKNEIIEILQQFILTDLDN